MSLRFEGRVYFAPLILVVAVLSIFCAPLNAQQPRAAATSVEQPDVQVLIMRGAGGQDMVDLTYPKVVPPAQAQRDVDSIGKASGQPASDVQITEGAVPFYGVAPTPMTSATFTISGAMPEGQNMFRIEPWIVALREYKTLAITYIVPPGFVFNGLQTFKNEFVDVDLDRRGGAVTYHVKILKSDFDRLDMPLTQADAAAIKYAADQRRQSTLRVLAVLAISVVAVAVGYSIFTFVSRVA